MPYVRLPLLVPFLLLLFTACGGGGSSNGDNTNTPPPSTHELFWNANPPSTLLPAGATTLAFTVNTNQAASCRYSVGQSLSFDAMTAFETGQGSTTHGVTFEGLNPDTTVLNDVYVRCDAKPDQVLHLKYRALPQANPSFPRKGNLWGSWQVMKDGGIDLCKRIDLWLGAGFTPTEIQQLRSLNPDVLVLDSINTVEHSDSEKLNLPDGYWLKDTTGKRIEVWNGAYRLNLTKPEVAAYQAQFAYQRMLDDGLATDGMFFDNFFTSESWLKADMWGNAVQIDANEDGQPDDPAWLDAAWKAGVYAELQAWRKFMPYAYASGHLQDSTSADVQAIFNGNSIGFQAPGTKDGNPSYSFANLWQAYNSWWDTAGRKPTIVMIESGPPFEIGYGYGYAPSGVIPPSTLKFARTYYPYVRWGLGVTLMNDGFFAHEIGDTWHGNDWWYDELDVDLGHPAGAAQRVDLGTTPTTDGITNGDFEQDLSPDWTHWANTTAGAAATFNRDTTQAKTGSASCRVDIANAGQSVDWHIALFQPDRSVVQGTAYDLKLWAKADANHPFSVQLQKGSSDWHSYGLSQAFTMGTAWQEYTVTFEATETASDGRLGFNVGSMTGSIWIDDVRLLLHPPDVFRRDFDKGTVLLNATRSPQTIPVSSGPYKRITGSQAPRYQYVVDDADAGFSFTGTCPAASFDSGQWKAAGPWYHDWGPGYHELDDTTSTAEWDLGIRANDTYTIDVWWPAAPAASGWSQQVLYEVLSGMTVVASRTFDQSQDGDQWHRIGSVPLTVAAGAKVRMTNLGAGPAIADAILVQSQARYNNGSAASSVELDPMDAILLMKQ